MQNITLIVPMISVSLEPASTMSGSIACLGRSALRHLRTAHWDSLRADWSTEASVHGIQIS